MEIRRTVAPTAEPISTGDLQEHLRAPVGGSDGALLAIYLSAAREAVEQATGRALMPQTWQVRLSEFPEAGGHIELPFPPIISVTSVAIINPEGDAETLAGVEYQVSAPSGPAAGPARLYPAADAEWPDTLADTQGAVVVTYQAGYANAAAVPAALRAAVMLVAGDLYENREASAVRVPGDIPAVKRLMDPFRVWTL
jgi:uncharacterized phiE125 gp8 family phage protein